MRKRTLLARIADKKREFREGSGTEAKEKKVKPVKKSQKRKKKLTEKVKRGIVIGASTLISWIPVATEKAEAKNPADNNHLRDAPELLTAKVNYLASKIDMEAEIDSYADYAIDRFSNSIKKERELQLSLKPTERIKHIKEIFNSVYEDNTIPGSASYCIATMVKCMQDAGIHEFEQLIPDPSTKEGGGANVFCTSFVQYIRKNFPQYIKKGKITNDNVQVGDIIFTKVDGTASGLHATAIETSEIKVVGDKENEIKKQASFNKTHIGNVYSGQEGYIVKTRDLIKYLAKENINEKATDFEKVSYLIPTERLVLQGSDGAQGPVDNISKEALNLKLLNDKMNKNNFGKG
jgi:hypothetical protein